MKWISAWFWSNQKPNENWAQTIFRVLGNLFRIAVSLVVMLIAGILSYSGLLNLWQQNFDQRRLVEVIVEHREQSERRTEDGAMICSEQRPLFVKMTNKSPQAVSNFVIKISARNRGQVEDRLGYPDNEVRWVDVIPPQHFYAACYGNQTIRENPRLVYSGEVRRDSVKLVPVEDWMYEETSTLPINSN